MKNIYDNIKMNELKFPDDDISSGIPVFADSTVIKEGWLWKQGSMIFIINRFFCH